MAADSDLKMVVVTRKRRVSSHSAEAGGESAGSRSPAADSVSSERGEAHASHHRAPDARPHTHRHRHYSDYGTVSLGRLPDSGEQGEATPVNQAAPAAPTPVNQATPAAPTPAQQSDPGRDAFILGRKFREKRRQNIPQALLIGLVCLLAAALLLFLLSSNPTSSQGNGATAPSVVPLDELP